MTVLRKELPVLLSMTPSQKRTAHNPGPEYDLDNKKNYSKGRSWISFFSFNFFSFFGMYILNLTEGQIHIITLIENS